MEALTQGLQGKDIIALLATNIVAFLIFFYFLRKYAWGPLLAMLDARRDKIQAEFDAADAELKSAEALRAEFDAKMVEIKEIQREKVQEAVKMGEGIAADLEKNARAKAAQYTEKAEADLDREVRAARMDLRASTVDMAIQAAEMVVKEKLDDKKHRQMIEEFITRLGESRAQ